MGVREGQQQHPIRMQRGKGEPEWGKPQRSMTLACPASDVFRHTGRARRLPEQVEHGGEEQLVVDGDAHVARFVEGGGDGPDGGPQGAPPAQEQKLSCGRGQVTFTGGFYQPESV